MRALIAAVLLLASARAHAQLGEGETGLEPRVHGPDIEVFGARNLDGLGADAFGIGLGIAPSLELPLWAEGGLGIHAGGMIFWLAPGQEQDGAMWVGTRFGLRWHWTTLLRRQDADGWIDLHHDFGRSGGITRHALDFGAGYDFALGTRVALGPYVRLFWASDPLGDNPVILIFGASLAIDPNVAAPPPEPEDPEHAWRYTSDMDVDPTPVPPPPRLPFGADRIVPDVELFAARNLDEIGAGSLGWGGGVAAHVELMLTRPVGFHVGLAGQAISSAQGGEDAVFVFASRFGLRAHWLAAANFTFADLWSDVHHEFARSGRVSRHGFDVGTGINFSLGSRFAIGPFARLIWGSDPLGFDPVQLVFGITAGFFERLRLADSDRDGVVDERDLCPMRTSGTIEDPDRPGCAARDQDGDGILDPRDACPTEAEGLYPDPNHQGCPASDPDGDGVPHGEDMCPNQPAGVANNPLAEGCPADPY